MNMLKNRNFVYLTGLFLSAVIGVSSTVSFYEAKAFMDRHYTRSRFATNPYHHTCAYLCPDLNNDGIPDLIIQEANGHKTPMYSALGDTIMFLSAKEMKQLNSKVDYDGIEAKLNGIPTTQTTNK